MYDKFGRYDVYSVTQSKYCYKDNTTLRNKFRIYDSNLLKEIETDISAIRQTEMYIEPITGRFSVHHLCRIHFCLFSDIYSFAGHIRKEDIAKGETRFLSYKEIKVKLTVLLDKLRDEKHLDGMDYNKLISKSAYYMAELNYIHPFREGNGRAIREFMRLLFLYNNYLIKWDAVSTDELMDAMIFSVYDTAALETVITKCMTKA